MYLAIELILFVLVDVFKQDVAINAHILLEVKIGLGIWLFEQKFAYG